MLEEARSTPGRIEEKSDQELVALTLVNQDDFIYLVDRYKHKLARYVRRLTNVALADIDDILQDIFLKIYRNLNDYDQAMSFSSWAYRIAHNQVISNYRAIAARPQGNQVGLEDDGVGELVAEIDIEREVDEKLREQLIARTLARLKPKYREILVLKFFEEKSYEEISDITRLPAGTVASRLSGAKKEFAREFKKINKSV